MNRNDIAAIMELRGRLSALLSDESLPESLPEGLHEQTFFDYIKLLGLSEQANRSAEDRDF